MSELEVVLGTKERIYRALYSNRHRIGHCEAESEAMKAALYNVADEIHRDLFRRGPRFIWEADTDE